MRKDKRTTDAFGCTEKPFGIEMEILENKLGKHSYETFFEGYKVITALRKNGRGHKVIRQYAGVCYHQELSKKQAVWLRVLYIFIFLEATSLLVLALCIRSDSNKCWYVMLSGLLVAVFYGRVLLALHTYVWSGIDLKLYEYRYGAVALTVRSKYAAYTVPVLLVTTLVMLILVPSSFSMMELLRLALLIMSGAIIWTLSLIEPRICYVEIQTGDPEVANKC